MTVAVGESSIDAAYVGATSLTGMYVGADQVWETAPSSLPYSIAWHSAFHADDLALADGAAVSSWADGSGNGRDLSQATASAQPTYRASHVALNNKPAVEGDGSDVLSSTATFTTLNVPYTVVVIGHATVINSAETFAAGTDTAFNHTTAQVAVNGSGSFVLYNGSVLAGPVADTSAHLFIAECDTASGGYLEIDGTTTAGSTGDRKINRFGLFAVPNTTASGFGQVAIAFAGLYNGTLSSTERADLLAWAQTTYGTP